MTAPRPPFRRRRSGRRRHAPALAAVLAILAVAGAFAVAGAQTTIPDPGWAVTVSPASGLVDGQRVTTNIAARDDVTVLNVEIRQCRLGATYAAEGDVLPSVGNCPTLALSSSSNSVVSRGTASGIIDRVRAPGGVDLEFKIGTGVATWSQPNGEFSLACDDTHPCALVVQVRLTTGFVYHIARLDFRSNDVIAACGGPAEGVLATGSADRLSDAWSSWTQRFCSSSSTAGAPTRATFAGEGVSMRQYSEGSLDVAYTSAGYNPSVGLVPPSVPARPSVATPIAVNAAVIAVGGGYRPTPFEKERYPELEVTAAEVAAIFGGGIGWYTSDLGPYKLAILERNPALGSDLYHLGVSEPRPAAPSTAESISWYVTNFLTIRSPADWISPGPPPIPRGATSSFVTADPPFPNVNTYSGRPSLEKVSEAAFVAFNTGPIWAITDLATARALDLTPVAIENAAGQFVAPTDESLLAAVSTLEPDENGLLIPDPEAVATPSAVPGAQAGVVPYPLTFVEYVLAPAEPLVDTPTCTLRSESQTLLTKWLDYITGDGQAGLPRGLVAVPPELEAEAASAIEQVGSSPVTGTCAGVGTPPGGNPAGAGSPAGGFAGSGIPGFGAPSSNLATARRGLAGVSSGAAASASSGASDSEASTEAVVIPAFAGRALPDTTGGIVALLGIVLVTSLAAWLTAGGRAATPALTGAGGRTVTGTRPAARPPAGGLVLLWFGVVATGVGLVVYQLGPMLQQRDQHSLVSEYKRTVRQAANEGSGLPGVSEVSKAPEIGDPIGVVEVGALRIQAVAIEGVGPSQTQQGPGHAPGTAGLGQPGNSVVVARRNGFGGEFADLTKLRKGDRILVTTTQGQSVYRVGSVREVTLVDGAQAEEKPADLASGGGTAKDAGAKTVTLDDLYGPTDDDRLTLVTSASHAFWNTSNVLVVSAKMVGTPFEPTPQGARSDTQTGRAGDAGAWAAVVLVLLLYAGAIVASVMLYRRLQFRVAYVLTVAPIVALTVIAGETLSRLLPAWL